MSPGNIISVVIPCRNEKKYIDRCLQSLVNCSYPKENLQVMVCDGLSEDGTAEIIKEYALKYPFIFYVENKHKLTPYAMNLGINYMPYDYILIMGAHSEIDADYISTCKQILDSSQEIGCVGGIIRNVFEDETSEVIGRAMASPFGVGNSHFRTGLKEGFVDTVGTPLYKKETLEKSGLFNENLVRNQDDELNYRVAKAGFKIYLTLKTGFSYYTRAAYKKLYKQYFQYGYWKVYVNRMHKTVTSVRQLVPLAFVLFLYTGLLLSLLITGFYQLYVFALVMYVLMALAFAYDATDKGKSVLPIAMTFFILHFSYGMGYLKGLLNFVLMGAKPGEKQKTLSR